LEMFFESFELLFENFGGDVRSVDGESHGREWSRRAAACANTDRRHPEDGACGS
jgi:hypothetical protein